MKAVIFVLAITSSLAGCATYKSSVPADYKGPTAMVNDSIKVHSGSKADFFYATSVDGVEIENSRIKTRIANQGRGMSMSAVVIERPVPARLLRLGIVARTEYAAPIQALTNAVYEVKGVIQFTPEPNKIYVVRGELGETYSAVWIVENSSDAIVGDKIEIKGSAKLGVFEK